MAGLFVTDIECLAAGVTDGVVVPRSEPELMSIFDPGVGGPAFRNDGSDVGISKKVDPGCGRDLAGSHADDILAAVVGESADAIEENEMVGRSRIGRGGGERIAGRDKAPDLSPRRSDAGDLLRKGLGAVGEDDAGDSLEKDAILFSEVLAAPDEDAPGSIDAMGPGAGSDEAVDAILQVLPVTRKIFV